MDLKNRMFSIEIEYYQEIWNIKKKKKKRSESTRDNFSKFIHQFQPKTKTLIKKLERILIKLYRQNLSLLFNQTCLNERLLPNYTHTHIYIYIYIYINRIWQ